MQADPLVVDDVERVAEDGGVAESLRVVEVDQQLLVVGVVLLVELRVAQEVDALAVGLLESLAQTAVRKFVVAREGDLADAHAVAAVDVENHVHGALADRVVLNAGSHLDVAEALLDEVGLDELRVLVDHVVREFGAAAQLELLGQVLLLAARDSLELPVVDQRTLLEEDLQIDAVAQNRGAHLHVGEVALVPETGDGVGDIAARQIERIARQKTRRRTDQIGIEVFHAAHVDVADMVELRCGALQHGSTLVEGGVLRRIGGFALLCGGRKAARQNERRRENDLTKTIHLS